MLVARTIDILEASAATAGTRWVAKMENLVSRTVSSTRCVALQNLQENLAGNGSLAEELVIAAAKYDLDHGTVTVLEKRWVENGSIQVQ